ncbi:phage holin family protein [Carnobacterium gallinarum]|uniref:phage holin family protein n=1 Tax=Carnobacterium gallinarum TaxID=2749 RepID=UPI000551FB9C|nr:phage holin family protein [Carnobacterium gallinarum]
MKFWQGILINALLFLALSGLFQSTFYVGSVWIALAASLVLAILNMAIKPILVILALPITVLTLGLFSIIINAGMLNLTSFIIGSSFHFSSFMTSIWIAILLSLVNTVIGNSTRDND